MIELFAREGCLMPSSRYRDLQTRVGELRRFLLPRKFDPTGTYPDRIHERARAFRLLAHAEFESFIEDRVVDVAHSRFLEWKRQRKVSPCLIALLAYDEAKKSPPGSILNRPQGPIDDLEARLERAKNAVTSYARARNHGVTEENILNLLMPLGVEESDLDLTWLASVHSWAQGRGDYAHKSLARLQVRPDPKDEYDTVRQLLAGFRDVDSLLDTR